MVSDLISTLYEDYFMQIIVNAYRFVLVSMLTTFLPCLRI